MAVGVIQKLLPVIRRHIVYARAQEITRHAQHGLMDGEHFSRRETFPTQQTIDR